jgi:hypothetical protein
MGFLGTETVYSLGGSSPPTHSIITTLARSYIKHRREDLEDGHFAACPPSPVLLKQLAGISRQRCVIITGLVIIVGMAKRRYKRCVNYVVCVQGTQTWSQGTEMSRRLNDRHIPRFNIP